MKRKFQEWTARFQQLSTPNEEARSISRSGLVENHSAGEDFTGKAIRGFEFGGNKVIVGTYKEMLVSLAGQLLRNHPDKFDAVVAHVRGQKPHFSHRKEDLRVPRELKPGVYLETNFPANQAAKVCRDLIEAFGFSPSSLAIEVVPFRTRAIKRTAGARGTESRGRGRRSDYERHSSEDVLRNEENVDG